MTRSPDSSSESEASTSTTPESSSQGEKSGSSGVAGDDESCMFNGDHERSDCFLTRPDAAVERPSLDRASHDEDHTSPCGLTTKALAGIAALAQAVIILGTVIGVHKYGLLTAEPEQIPYVDKSDVEGASPGRLAEDYGGFPSAILDPGPRTSTPEVTKYNITGNQSGRSLVCLFADTFEGDFPAHLCSHLVFMDAVLDLDTRIIRPNSAEQGRPVFQRFIGQSRELHPRTGTKFLVSLWDARVQDTYQELFRDWSRATQVAGFAEAWLRRAGLDGLALVNLPFKSSNAYDLLGIFKALRAVLGGEFMLIFGFHRVSSKKMELSTEKALRDITRITNFTFLETHDARPYNCRVFLPNAYRSLPEDEAGFSITRELIWSAGSVHLYPLEERRLCVTLSVAAFRFVLHATTSLGPGSRCYSYYAASFRQHCPDQNENGSTYDDAAMSLWWKVSNMGPPRATRLEAFDSADSIRHKLNLLLDEFPQLCVALYHADLEDYRGTCDNHGEPFARISAVRQILDSRVH
ncbi:uncharacterized protein LOC135393026 [Ornithodoros turicata]|uniref:uncharacterized protein LOC135393026 n=1 Tax=Ornithodoros turicata TaxID=34597 RepID=UPI00313973BB